jgi:hypothetical protein
MLLLNILFDQCYVYYILNLLALPGGDIVLPQLILFIDNLLVMSNNNIKKNSLAFVFIEPGF